MKICIINNLYKPYSIGGAEQVIELIVEEFKKAGHSVFVVTTAPIFCRRREFEEKQSVHYIRSMFFVFIRSPKFIRLLWHVLENFNFISYFKIRAILNKENPDLVFTHNLIGIGYLIPGLLKKLQIKHAHALHDIQLLHPSGLMNYGQENIINSWIAKIYQGFTKYLFKSTPIVVSPSKWLMTEHINKGFFVNSRQSVIPSPVKFLSSKASYCIKKQTIFKLLYIGQIEKHKGVNILIGAFKIVLEKGGNFELMLVGSGSRADEYKRIAVEQAIGGVTFTGKIDNHEVIGLMLRSNCLIVPSMCYENSPTVIYEAIGAKLPVIASRIGGITELIHKCGGMLFAPGSTDELAKKIIWAQKNPAHLLKIAENGIKNINKYKPGNYIEKLLSI